MLLTDLASVLSVHPLASVVLQTPDAINTGHATLLEVFTGIIAASFVIIAAVVLFAGLAALKAVRAIQAEVTELRGKAAPFITESRSFVTEMTPKVRAVVDDLQPKIKNISSRIDEIVSDVTPKVKEMTVKINDITGHVERIAGLAREKAEEFGPTVSSANQTVKDANETVQEANRKVRSQVGRVNGMISATLDSAARLGVAIEHRITRPGREVAGIVSGLKVGLDTLLSGARAFGSGKVGSTARPEPQNVLLNRPGGPARPAVVPYRSLADQRPGEEPKQAMRVNANDTAL